jgi:hypothetical protein
MAAPDEGGEAQQKKAALQRPQRREFTARWADAREVMKSL